MKLPFQNKADRPAVNPASFDGPRETASHSDLGRRGELLALAHLEREGYRLVAANFSLPIGRDMRGVVVNAEIDVVAYDGPVLCFVEVKTRASDEFAPPQINVDLRKRRQIARAARAYRRMLSLTSAPHRYDVVTVVLAPDREDESAGRPRIELLKGFWTDSPPARRRWDEARWD